MTDTFENYKAGLGSPASKSFAIDMGEAGSMGYYELPVATRGIYIGVTGDLIVKLVGDESFTTFVDVPAGSVLPLRIASIDTSTDCDFMVGLY